MPLHLLGDVPTWIGATAALISAVGVVGGGGWAYFKFLKDAPYIARANLGLRVTLLTYDGHDLIQASCVASAVGQGQITFIKEGDDAVPPTITVYRVTREVLETPPEEWVESCGAAEIFAEDDMVAGGEILEDVVLIWVGERLPDTVAYRVVAWFEARDTPGSDDCSSWQAVAVVPVNAVVEGSPEATDAGVPKD